MSLEDEIKKLTEAIRFLTDRIDNFNMCNLLSSNNKKNESRLIPVPKWNVYHEWPSIAGLRFMIFHEKTNGMSCCISRIGRRVMIIEDEFFKWAKKQSINTLKEKS